jgi:hypothetical protein
MATPRMLPIKGAICAYFPNKAAFTSGNGCPAFVAWASPDGLQVNVAYLDEGGGWFKDGPIPFLQDIDPLPASKGFCSWTTYSPP